MFQGFSFAFPLCEHVDVSPSFLSPVFLNPTFTVSVSLHVVVVNIVNIVTLTVTKVFSFDFSSPGVKHAFFSYLFVCIKAHLEHSSIGRGTRQQVVGCERVGNGHSELIPLECLYSQETSSHSRAPTRGTVYRPGIWTQGAGDSALCVYVSYLSCACSYVKSPYTRAG